MLFADETVLTFLSAPVLELQNPQQTIIGVIDISIYYNMLYCILVWSALQYEHSKRINRAHTSYNIIILCVIKRDGDGCEY